MKTTAVSIIMSIIGAIFGFGFVTSTGIFLMITAVYEESLFGVILATALIVGGFVLTWFVNHEGHRYDEPMMYGDEEES